MTPEALTWLIPLPPILAFALIVLFTNRSNRLSHTLAVGAMTISWGLAMAVFWKAITTPELGQHPFAASIDWLPTGSGSLRFGILIDPLSAMTLFFVAWTCLAIFVYSIGYHNYGKPRDPADRAGLPPHAGGIEPMYARFFAFISLFAFGMLVLVIADNLLLLFMGWEIMGLCSYLLIGFWYGKDSAKKAMIKAFITTRVGDVFMLLGIAYLYSATGTLNYRAILFNEEVLARLAAAPSGVLGMSAAGLIGLLLFLGTVGKSAQWPLHVWLPDAMEGPTPVSAMIHAATMVSAGVYLAVKFFPLLTAGWHEGEALTTTMRVVAFIGAFTALFAATIALSERDIKRVLAYSTISQLGYMVAAVGIGAYVAAAFHLFTHAFFKALLFLGSGSVIHGVEHGVAASSTSAAQAMPGQAGPAGVHEDHAHVDAQDMFNMGGLRRKMPRTFLTFLIGGFALAGFPLLTAGFWSKDEILADAFGNGHWAVFLTLAAAALLTAFYTMRQITLTFLGEPRTEAARHAHESTATMTAPLVVLAVFAVAAGWLGIPEAWTGGQVPNWFHDFVGGTLLERPPAAAFHWTPLLTSVGVSLGGLFLGWLVYRRVAAGAPDPLKKPLGFLYTVLERKYGFDELYDWALVRPAYWFAETFTYLWIDRGVIDGILHGVARLALRIGSVFRNDFDKPVVNGLIGDGTASVVKWAGRQLRAVQTGRVQQYLIAGLIVTGILLSYVLVVRPSGSPMQMLQSHLLTLILFSPAVAALVILALPREKTGLLRWFAFLASLIPFGLALWLWAAYDPARAGYQFVEQAAWYPTVHSSYHLGVDGISIPMVLLTTLLTPLSILISWSITENVRSYMALFLLLETGMLGVFVALDLLLFFVFWEIGLVPMYFLINQWGSANRGYASFKFLIYTMAGSLGLLLAIQMIGVASGTFDLITITERWAALDQPLTVLGLPITLPIATVKAVAFWAFVIAFAIKVPIWPFHTWLPDAHTEAPTAGSMILAGVLLKLGAYGFLRLVLPLFPEQARMFAGVLGLLAVLAIIFGAFASWGQDDFKRLVAYSSVNHMGFVVLGIAAAAFARGSMSEGDAVVALNGAVLQMFNHGLSAAGMFLLVGVIYERTHTRSLKDWGGLFPLMPVYGGILIFTGMASLGLPGLNGFVSEFMVVRGAWPIFTLYTALSMIGLLITGAYILKGIKLVLHGPLNEKWAGHRLEIGRREVIAIAPLMGLMLLIGVWPSWIVGVINQTVMRLFG